jgi:hypothetical protein
MSWLLVILPYVLHVLVMDCLCDTDVVRFHWVSHRSHYIGHQLLQSINRRRQIINRNAYHQLITRNQQRRVRCICDTLWPMLEPYLFPTSLGNFRTVLLTIHDPDLSFRLQPGGRVITIRPLFGLDGNEYGKVVLFVRCYRHCVCYDSVVVLSLATQNWQPEYDPVYIQLQHFLGASGLSREQQTQLKVRRASTTVFRTKPAARDPAAAAYWYAYKWMVGASTYEAGYRSFPRSLYAPERQELFDFIFRRLPAPTQIF